MNSKERDAEIDFRTNRSATHWEITKLFTKLAAGCTAGRAIIAVVPEPEPSAPSIMKTGLCQGASMLFLLAAVSAIYAYKSKSIAAHLSAQKLEP